MQDIAKGKAIVIDGTNFKMLLDRSSKVFGDRTKGWTSAGDESLDQWSGKGKEHTFGVYETPTDPGND